jgi:phage-related protein
VGEFFTWLGVVGPPLLEEIRGIWADMWPKIATAAQTAWGYIEPVIRFYGDYWMWVWRNVLRPAGEWIATVMWPAIVTAVQWAWPYVRDAVTAIGDVISMVWDDHIVPAWAWWQEAWPGIAARVHEAWGYIEPVITWLGEAITTIWTNVAQPFYEWWYSTMWTAISGAVETAWPVIRTVFEVMGAWLRNLWEMWKTFGRIVGAVWPYIKLAAEEAWGYIRDHVLEPMLEGINEAIRLIDRLTPGSLGQVGGFSGSAGGDLGGIVGATSGVPIGGPSAAELYAPSAGAVSRAAVTTLAPGASTTGSGDTYVFNVSAIDGHSVRRFLAEHGRDVAETVRRVDGRAAVTG